MKYLLAGTAAASLLMAGVASAQPVANADGAVGSTVGQAGATATGGATANAPLAPNAPVDQTADHANHALDGAKIKAGKAKDKLTSAEPNAAAGGSASGSTSGASAQGSASATPTG